MAYQLGTPFDNIESAREYVNQLLAATREAQAEIETELRRVTDPEVSRVKEMASEILHKTDEGKDLAEARLSFWKNASVCLFILGWVLSFLAIVCGSMTKVTGE